MQMKLNLGCGWNKRQGKGWVNVDKSKLCNPDYVWDITRIPWPESLAKENSVGYVVLQDVLEHLGDKMIDVIKEVHRVCRNGAEVWIRVPRYDVEDAYVDPTHNRFFSEHTFEYFDCNHPRWFYQGRLYGIPPFRKISVRKGLLHLTAILKVVK